MGFRTATLFGICQIVLALSLIGADKDYEITPLQHGLLRADQPVRRVNGMWTMVITFPQSTPSVDPIAKEVEKLRSIVEHWQIEGYSNRNALQAHYVERKTFWINQIDLLQTRLMDTKRGRTKRGLLDFVGEVGKSLFGISTVSDIRELHSALSKNQKLSEAMYHDTRKLLSTINVTRLEISENRNTINQILNTTASLRHWVLNSMFRLNKELGNDHLLGHIREQYIILSGAIDRITDIRQQFLQARRDLESGRLSECLLPPSVLQTLTVSPKLGKNMEFVQPLFWYYSNVDVKVMSWEKDLLYVVRLPLVANQAQEAVTYRGYPVPNLEMNVTLRILTPNPVLLNTDTGLNQDLEGGTCHGKDPLVCLPAPVPRYRKKEITCGAALTSQHRVLESCKVEVKPRAGDIILYNDINDYILVTWGTVISSECRHGQHLTLKAGTYHIRWNGDCSICTRELCVPSTVLLHSAVPIHTWLPLNISDTRFQNVSRLKLPGLITPTPLPEIQTIDLGHLLMPNMDFERWTGEHTSIASDISIALIFLIIVIICLLCLYKYRSKIYELIQRDRSSESKTVPVKASLEFNPLEGTRFLDAKIFKDGEV